MIFDVIPSVGSEQASTRAIETLSSLALRSSVSLEENKVCENTLTITSIGSVVEFPHRLSVHGLSRPLRDRLCQSKN